MSQVQRVRVLRAFRHKGEDLGVGSVLTLDTPLASELRAGRKVEFVAADTKGNVVELAKKDKSNAPAGLGVAEIGAKLDAIAKQLTPLEGVTEQLAALVAVLEKGVANAAKGGK